MLPGPVLRPVTREQQKWRDLAAREQFIVAGPDSKSSQTWKTPEDGPDLLRECAQLGGCATGDARLTRGFRLPARYVIHAVGPVWSGGSNGEPDLLASCYRRSLELASEAGARRIAFPSISTGIYGYPIEPAARIAVTTVRAELDRLRGFDEVVFCCFSARDLEVYRRQLGEVRT